MTGDLTRHEMTQMGDFPPDLMVVLCDFLPDETRTGDLTKNEMMMTGDLMTELMRVGGDFPTSRWTRTLGQRATSCRTRW